jgi:hypothetical protein
MEKSLPILDQISVASPCHVNWDDMTGDDRARFCSHCKLNVYDLSAMTRDEATAFIHDREGRTCVRFYRRHDGTILTRDCPVGLRAVRKRLTRAVAALAGVVVALIGGTLFGSRANRLMPEGFRSPGDAFSQWVDPQPEFESAWVGMIATPQIPIIPEGELVDEPAETPLPQPTAEQLDVIQERLTSP